MYTQYKKSILIQLICGITILLSSQAVFSATKDNLFSPDFSCKNAIQLSEKTICANKKLSILNKLWGWRVTKEFYMSTERYRDNIFRHYQNWEIKTHALCKSNSTCLENYYQNALRNMDIEALQMQMFMFDSGQYIVKLSEMNKQETMMWHTFSSGINKVGIIYKCKNTDYAGFICVFDEVILSE